MDQKHVDTLANLISHELHRVGMLIEQAKQHGYQKGVDYWTNEVKTLHELDAVIWDSIKKPT